MEWIKKLRQELYPRILKSVAQIDKIRVFLALAVVVGSGGGLVYGFFLARATVRPPTPMAWVEDVGYTIPVMSIEGYTDKELVLRTDTLGMRIKQGDEILSAPPDTSFRVILDDRLKAALPEAGSGNLLQANQACNFVAGTTGKYAYPAEDSRAKRLKTRRCFATEKEALAAGLQVPEK